MQYEHKDVYCCDEQDERRRHCPILTCKSILLAPSHKYFSKRVFVMPALTHFLNVNKFFLQTF